MEFGAWTSHRIYCRSYLSLHAPNQQARTAIVPTATRYPIEKLVEALDEHMMVLIEQRRQRRNDGGEGSKVPATRYTIEERKREGLRQRAMIEYVMLVGETSSLECAHQLGKLCENRHLVVNLIPYNQTDVEDELRCPSTEHMQKFRDIVASYGTFCTIRRTMGADIASACGQLVQKKSMIDIEDVVTGQTSRKSTSEAAVNVSTRKDFSDALEERSWLELLSGDDLNRWFGILAFATTVSFACFMTSTALFLKPKK
jgi:hypothetical protein